MINTSYQDLKQLPARKRGICLVALGDTQLMNEIKPQLLDLDRTIRFHSDLKRCTETINRATDQQLMIIISSPFATEVLQSIHDSNTVAGIFILGEFVPSTDLTERYSKILHLVTDKETLLNSIREQLQQLEKDTLVFSLFDQKQKSTRDLSQESAAFLWHQMLLHVLKQMPQNDRAMHDMLQQCAEYYRNNSRELTKIEQFRTTYTHDQAIRWYTDECFLYKLLNQALRTEDIQLLYSFRFFIIDLCSELEKEHMKIIDQGVFTVYRGQLMHKDELNKLQRSIGCLISTNGFLSTSRDLAVSSGFLTRPHTTSERVLLEIQVNPALPGVICADIATLGSMSWEKEVLFSLNTVFQIVSVDFDATMDAWTVRLTASDPGAEKLNDYSTWLQSELDCSSALVYFGRLLWHELGQLKQAENYFKMLLDSLPSDHSDIASIYLELGHIQDEKGEYDVALNDAEQALRIRQEQVPVDLVRLAASFNGTGVIYQHKGNLDRAIDYYQQALTTLGNPTTSGMHLHQANSLSNLGVVHRDKGNIDRALDYFNQAYEIRRKILPEDHPRLADTLSNIGSVVHYREDFDRALQYYQQALAIQEKNCPDDHLGKANTIRNIALIYRDEQDWNNAIDYFQRSLTIHQRLLGDEPHPNVAMCLGDIGNTYEKMDDWNHALDYYQRQIAMEEECLPFDHPHLALHFDWIVNTLKKNGQVNEGTKRCHDQLAMLVDILGENFAQHPRYCHTLVSLATMLDDSDFNKAKDYYLQAFRSLQQYPHMEAYRCCLSSMTNFFWKHKMFDEALEYQLKLVRLNRATLSSNNKELAVSLRGLARLYRAMKEGNEAMVNFNESLNIFRAIYTPEHQHVKDLIEEMNRREDSADAFDAALKVADDDDDTLIHPSIDRQPMPSRMYQSQPASRPAASTACILS